MLRNDAPHDRASSNAHPRHYHDWVQCVEILFDPLKTLNVFYDSNESQPHKSEDTMTDLFTAQKDAHFPMQLPQGIVGRTVDMQTYFDVEDALEPLIFPENELTERWFSLPSERRDERKQALFALQRQTHQDAVVFYDGETAIGWSAGRMTGAGEFMMDVSGVHPDYQGKGIYTAFLRLYLPYLRDVGYERVVSYHSPTNRAVLIAKLKAGFTITATEFRENAGASVKVAYFLHQDRYQRFEDVHSLQPQRYITHGE